ncbi:MAG TPA: NAD(P)H-dependent oxidoreductase [Bryobacteraceae bacterium]|jgi:FMN-dependent NADH-azoreductase|nr:NAD(P)H-dependent oxidoreductase [Bryobacteraceae bacterium]
MATLLRIDSSPLGDGASFSRQLTSEFVELWKRTHPHGRVIARDVAATPLSPIDAEWIGAAYAPKGTLTARQREALTLSDELIAELKTADEYVIGVPMHNFSIPGALKLWVDQIARVGETFSYENGAPAGLLQGKKVTFLVASGGVYDQGTPAFALNFIEPYLRSFFSFLGVKEMAFISASGTARHRFGVDRGTILQPAFATIQGQLQAA